MKARSPGLIGPPPYIIGVDEVGVGCWAGPIVVCAVLAPSYFSIEGLTDSKKMSKKRHITYDVLIRKQAEAICVVAANNEDIDDAGIHQVQRDCIRRVIAELRAYVGAHLVIIDGEERFDGCVCLPKADFYIQHVSAASVVAKRMRDAAMQRLSSSYPGYDFGQHVGYGTKSHQAAIKEFGVCDIHRRSYRPIREALKVKGTVRTSGSGQWAGPGSATVIYLKTP